MAQQVIKRLIDDLDGDEAEETVSFAIDGVTYEIDLSAENARILRDRLSPFVQRARRSGGVRQQGSRAVAAAGAARTFARGRRPAESRSVNAAGSRRRSSKSISEHTDVV
ncbi:hypothetical protein GCM10029978_048830 [Actinoallomurus acanthiterrae]